VSKINQVKALRRGAEIVVATPGRLLDHVRDGSISLSQVEVLVLDEADHMFDMGFLPDVRRIVSAVPKQRQTMLFSATMPPEIRGLADSVLTQPETIQIGQIAPAKTVAHALYPVPEMRKLDLLVAMLNQTETQRVLIFTRTKRRASDLAERLERHGHNVTALQGNMAQNARQKAINGFRNGEYKILVATDIAARGIDVPHISHVINYDMPDTVDAYTHRIGRTGRAHEVGEAFTYVQPMDEIAIRDVERLLGSRIERRRLDGFDYGTFSPERQGQAQGSQRKPTQAINRNAPRARFNAPPEERGGFSRQRTAQPARAPRPQ
jgi:ATP-dependent RNA helicase RhlE